jgi:hypothetical protein
MRTAAGNRFGPIAMRGLVDPDTNETLSAKEDDTFVNAPVILASHGGWRRRPRSADSRV